MIHVPLGRAGRVRVRCAGFASALLGLALLAAAPAGAEEGPWTAPTDAPNLIHYQARLTDPAGVPLAGPVSLRFRLFDRAEGGTPLWSETHDAVDLVDGAASVLLGSVSSLPVDGFFGAQRWLGIAVDGAAELAPRLRIAAVPYALEASRLRGKTDADFEPRGTVVGLAVSDGSPPNQGQARVHWDILTGVPAGFADGEDTGVTVHADLTGLTGGDDHPQYARDDDLSASGGAGPNTGKNLVHWENLVGVPSGFADGADNTGSGGSSDHGGFTGLADDDHPQYATDDDLAAHEGAPDPHSQYTPVTAFDTHAADTTLHGRTTDAGQLASGTLDPARLATGSVDGGHVADNSLTGDDVADGSLLSADFAPGALDSVLLGPDAVTTVEIADGTVGSADLADGAVDTADLADSAVTAQKLQADAVTGAAVADGSLTGDDLADGSVGAADLVDEPGLASASDSGTQVVGALATQVLEATIDCPAAGFVLALGTFQACIEPPGGPSDEQVEGSVSLDNDALDDDARVVFRAHADAGQFHCGSVASQKIFAVGPGETTVYLVARSNGTAVKTASRRVLSLVFIPTAY